MTKDEIIADLKARLALSQEETAIAEGRIRELEAIIDLPTPVWKEA